MARLRVGDTVKDSNGNEYKVKGFKPEGFVDVGGGRAIFGPLLTRVTRRRRSGDAGWAIKGKAEWK